MATILQQPDTLSLSRNLKKVIISSGTLVSFQLLKGVDILIDEYSYPDVTGRVEIDLSEIVTSSLSISLPAYESGIIEQSNLCAKFSLVIDGTKLGEFTAVRGGVAGFSGNAGTFLKANFLTWQPQQKEVLYDQPEWLSFYAAEESMTVKARFYLKNGTTQEVTIEDSMTPGNIYSLNTQFARLWQLGSGERYGYIDVWTEDADGVQLSYIQRYICRQKQALDEIYLAENSLGGLDTVLMNGAKKHTPEIERENIQLGDTKVTGTIDIANTYSQNTGMLEPDTAKWLFDLLKSEKVYHLVGGTISAIVVDTQSVSVSNMDSLSAFEFTFRISNDKGLLNITRYDYLPEVLEIPGPDNNLFFLTPRLIDFPTVNPDSELIIPVQTPFLQQWYHLSLEDLKSAWDIESLVRASHIHGNLSLLEKFSTDSEGLLLFEGKEVGAGALPSLESYAHKNRDNTFTGINSFENGKLLLDGYGLSVNSNGAVSATPPTAGSGSNVLWEDDNDFYSVLNVDGTPKTVALEGHRHTANDITDLESWIAGKNYLTEITSSQITSALGYSPSAYTDQKISALINGAPETLDTLDELAAALKDNADIVDVLNGSISNKVDKVAGKGLSTNDFTDALLAKLNGIETGAEKNIIEGITLNGVALTPNTDRVVALTEIARDSRDNTFTGTNSFENKKLVLNGYKLSINSNGAVSASVPTAGGDFDIAQMWAALTEYDGESDHIIADDYLPFDIAEYVHGSVYTTGIQALQKQIAAVNASIPTALKSPYALTINDVVYDGSAAKSITGLATQSWVEKKGYTTNKGTVTGVKMNGNTKSPSNGIVDLGTVITAHQSLSDLGITKSAADINDLITTTQAANTFLGKTATAADSSKLGGSPASSYATTAQLGNYLSLSGGTITNSGREFFNIKSTDNNPYISFYKGDTSIGHVGAASAATFLQAGTQYLWIPNSGNPYFYLGSNKTIYHTGNLTAATLGALTDVSVESTGTPLSWNSSSYVAKVHGKNIGVTMPSIADTTTALIGSGNSFIHSGNIGSQHTLTSDYLATYAASGTRPLDALQNIFDSIPKSVGTAVRTEHSSHAMAFGWFLKGYAYSNAYGGWFVSNYSTPQWVGVSNGDWTYKNFAFTDSNVASATKLNDNTAYTAWGQTFFQNGVPKNVSGAITLSKTAIQDGYNTSGELTIGAGYAANSLGVHYTGNVIYFRTGTGTNERMRITSNGNVLIGTTTDSGVKLNVNGSINLANGYNLTWGGVYGAGIPTIVGAVDDSLYFYPTGSTSSWDMRIAQGAITMNASLTIGSSLSAGTTTLGATTVSSLKSSGEISATTALNINGTARIYLNHVGYNYLVTPTGGTLAISTIGTANDAGSVVVIGNGYLSVKGNISATGAITAQGNITAFTSSSRQLKDILHDNHLSYSQRLMKIGRVVDFRYNNVLPKGNERHIGLIYEDVLSSGVDIYNMCHTSDGYGALNYISPDYINLIAGATQDNITEIDRLKAEVRRLQNRINELERRAAA